jgi:N4-(beta-N-acetylglucosaminyl)-L-asparaginase
MQDNRDQLAGDDMRNRFSRRDFLKAGIGATSMAVMAKGNKILSAPQSSRKMVIIASGNGLRAVDKAMELLKQGEDPLDAVIAGVNIVESDPNDMSVGYGGLPNEEGVVELDASVMHGPTHNAGAVASLRNIKNPSKVAKLVMERTDHAILVGEGALKFAKAHGFKEEDLLTDKAREKWLEWKEKLSDRDDWFPPKSDELDEEFREVLRYHGTINCCALNAQGNLVGVTTTSGLSYKIPGRVGDSPIIGAGLYVDNDVGAAGSTGRGEANILNCGSFTVVEFMRNGFSPEEACLKTLERIADKSKLQPHLLNDEGKPRFGLSFYAVNKKGEYGSADMWSREEGERGRFAVHDGTESRLVEAAYLFERKDRR